MHSLPIILVLLCQAPLAAADVSQTTNKLTVRGKVTTESGAPLKNAHVRFRLPGLDEVAAYTKTDEKGEYEIRGLDPGSYSAIVGRSGFISSPIHSVRV